MIEIFQIIFRVIVFIELGVFLHEFEVLLVKQYYQVKRFSKVVYNHYKYLIFILLFLDLLSNLERIGDHSTNIAEIVVENNA